MFKLFNLTTCDYDLARYADADDLRRFTRELGLDGIEVLPVSGDSLGIIPPELALGVHLSYFNSWLDAYLGDEAAVAREYGSSAEAARQLGGDPARLSERLRAQLDWCERIGARYVVWHVANVTLSETATYHFEHTDAQVVRAALEVANAALAGRRYGFWFLMENLWWPGFTFTRPEITRALLDGIAYPRKGIMLDLGHLMHTRLDIDSPEAGVEYIGKCLDAHGELCRYIKGVHLHSGATGEYVRAMLRDPPRPQGSYFDRLCALYEHVLRIDPHVPLSCPGARALIERISPEYLTYEFITRDRAQHAEFIRAQTRALSP